MSSAAEIGHGSNSMEGGLLDTLMKLAVALAVLAVGGLARWISKVNERVVTHSIELSSIKLIADNNAKTMQELSNAMVLFIEKHKSHDAFQEQQRLLNEKLFTCTNQILQASAAATEHTRHVDSSLQALIGKVEDLDEKLDRVRISNIGNGSSGSQR